MNEGMVLCPHCGGTGKTLRPLPLYPQVAEGARYQHDCFKCIFLGQYDDADLYACLSIFGEEKMSDGKVWKGQWGSLFYARTGDKTYGGVPHWIMYHKCGVRDASKVSFEDDPYMNMAFKFAKEKGLVFEDDGVMFLFKKA